MDTRDVGAAIGVLAVLGLIAWAFAHGVGWV